MTLQYYNMKSAQYLHLAFGMTALTNKTRKLGIKTDMDFNHKHAYTRQQLQTW
jgi:hypothetical protein